MSQTNSTTAVTSRSAEPQRRGRTTRFAKGRSGNPKGRPKGCKNNATIIGEALTAKISVSQGGGRKQITKADAFVQLLASRALKGDLNAADMFLSLAEKSMPASDTENQGGWLVVPGVSKSREEWERVHGAAGEDARRREQPVRTVPFSIDSGDALWRQGKLDEALACFRRALQIAEASYNENPDDADSRAELGSVVRRIGGLSYQFIYKRQFAEGLQCAEEALAFYKGEPLSPAGHTWVMMFQIGRAHALMFLGRTEEARAIYLSHCGERFLWKSRQRTFEAIVLEQFDHLRASELWHPMMGELERDYAGM